MTKQKETKEYAIDTFAELNNQEMMREEARVKTDSLVSRHCLRNDIDLALHDAAVMAYKSGIGGYSHIFRARYNEYYKRKEIDQFEREIIGGFPYVIQRKSRREDILAALVLQPVRKSPKPKKEEVASPRVTKGSLSQLRMGRQL